MSTPIVTVNSILTELFHTKGVFTNYVDKTRYVGGARNVNGTISIIFNFPTNLRSFDEN